MQHIIISASNERGPGYYEVSAHTTKGTLVPLDKVVKASADYSLIVWRLNYLVGRLLTQADAAFSDPVQRKAFKDCIRQAIAEEFGFFSEHLCKGLINDTLAEINNLTDEEFEQYLKDNPPIGIEEVIAPGK